MAIVNSRIPRVLIPVTIYHELAHRQGLASESDANFVISESLQSQ